MMSDVSLPKDQREKFGAPIFVISRNNGNQPPLLLLMLNMTTLQPLRTPHFSVSFLHASQKAPPSSRCPPLRGAKSLQGPQGCAYPESVPSSRPHSEDPEPENSPAHFQGRLRLLPHLSLLGPRERQGAAVCEGCGQSL